MSDFDKIKRIIELAGEYYRLNYPNMTEDDALSEAIFWVNWCYGDRQAQAAG